MDIKNACSYNAHTVLSYYSVSDVFIISMCCIVITGCIHACYEVYLYSYSVHACMDTMFEVVSLYMHAKQIKLYNSLFV